MKWLTRTYVRLREFHERLSPGQTMAEYGLILAAVAVIVYAGYLTLGGDINNLLNTVDADL